MANNPYSCTYSDDLKAVEEIARLVKMARQVGLPLPPALEAAVEAAKAGRNVETALNETCDALNEFMNTVAEKCARDAGYSSYDDMDSKRPTDWLNIDERYDPCVQKSMGRGYGVNYHWALRWDNPDSFARRFGEKEWEQLKAWIARMVRRRVRKATGVGGRGIPDTGSAPSSPTPSPSPTPGPAITQG